MAFQAIKAAFCGPAGCCVRTSPSDSHLEPTYKQFNDDVANPVEIIRISNSHTGRHSRRSNRNPNERIEEIELKDITSPREMDDEEMPTWRGDDLCDLHRKSVRRRRLSLSLSNLLDLTEPETNVNAFSVSAADKRSTFPPSRRKNENMRGKRINNLRNAAEFYQIAYSRLDPEEQERQSSSANDTSVSSFSTADSSFEWQYDNLNSHRCFEICTDTEMEKNCERGDLVGDSYTLYNVIRCPMCRVTNSCLGKPEDQQFVRLYI